MYSHWTVCVLPGAGHSPQEGHGGQFRGLSHSERAAEQIDRRTGVAQSYSRRATRSSAICRRTERLSGYDPRRKGQSQGVRYQTARRSGTRGSRGLTLRPGCRRTAAVLPV
eukprot:5476244-Prymnesium_polylepis.1